jgi:hypothetical protein
MQRIACVLFVLIGLTSASEASMNDQTILGTASDARISRCGLVVSSGAMATIRPFIETSSAVAGSLRLTVAKQSSSGTSQTSQSWNFSGGELGASSVSVDLPAEVSIDMDVTDINGTGLCRLETQLQLNREGSAA